MDAKEYIKLSPEEKLMRAIFSSYQDDTLYLKDINGVTLRKAVESAIFTLPVREQAVLRLRYGVEEFEGTARTLEAVGKVFNVTRERIRQIENKGLRKLRYWTRSRLLKPYVQNPERLNARRGEA